MAQFAGTAEARTRRESTAQGLVTPGDAGMAQALDPSWLGPYGNRQHENWEPPGGVGMVQSLELRGLGPQGNWQREDRDARGRGHGAVAGTARARTPRELAA